jgi:hypothetical protein
MSALPPIADIAERDRHVDPVRRKANRVSILTADIWVEGEPVLRQG